MKKIRLLALLLAVLLIISAFSGFAFGMGQAPSQTGIFINGVFYTYAQLGIANPYYYNSYYYYPNYYNTEPVISADQARYLITTFTAARDVLEAKKAAAATPGNPAFTAADQTQLDYYKAEIADLTAQLAALDARYKRYAYSAITGLYQPYAYYNFYHNANIATTINDVLAVNGHVEAVLERVNIGSKGMTNVRPDNMNNTIKVTWNIKKGYNFSDQYTESFKALFNTSSALVVEGRDLVVQDANGINTPNGGKVTLQFSLNANALATYLDQEVFVSNYEGSPSFRVYLLNTINDARIVYNAAK